MFEQMEEEVSQRTERYKDEQLGSSLVTPLVVSGEKMCWKILLQPRAQGQYVRDDDSYQSLESLNC